MSNKINSTAQYLLNNTTHLDRLIMLVEKVFTPSQCAHIANWMASVAIRNQHTIHKVYEKISNQTDSVASLIEVASINEDVKNLREVTSLYLGDTHFDNDDYMIESNPYNFTWDALMSANLFAQIKPRTSFDVQCRQHAVLCLESIRPSLEHNEGLFERLTSLYMDSVFIGNA